MKGMNILICGDRNWSDRGLMLEVLLRIKRKTDRQKGIVTVIHGACKGADEMAGSIARQFGISSCWKEKPYPANWKKYGRAGGPIRNQKMLDKGEPDLVLAFHNNLRKSKGTLDMVFRALEHGILVRLYPRKKRK